LRRPSIVAKWPAQASRIQGAGRIVATFVFMQSGTMKLFAFPVGVPPNGGAVPRLSQAGLGGISAAGAGAWSLDALRRTSRLGQDLSLREDFSGDHGEFGRSVEIAHRRSS
jgi:hypothetical protein